MLVDLLPAVVAYWDRDGRNVIANPAYREWFGVSPDQMQGRHLREVLGEELYARNLPHIQAALSGHRQSFQRTLADASGALRHAQASYVPDVVDGVVQGFCVLLTDITPEVAAQHALAEAQQLAELGSWQLDLATGQLVWSSQMYRIAGIDPDGAAPTLEAAIELIHPEDRDRVRAVLDTVQESGETYELDYRLVRPDGVVREIRSRGTADLKANGTPVRLSGTWQDVTASNEGARSLAVLNDELQEVNQLNADVLGMLGHDIRQPLAILLGFLDVVTGRWDRIPDEQRRTYVERALAAARKTAAMFSDILALASADAGSITTVRQPVDLLGAVREAVASDPRRGAVDIQCTDEPWVMVDPFHLQQILTNLLSNAEKYGEPPVSVRIDCSGDHVTMRVADHGQGVPRAFVDQLFQRFERASTGIAAQQRGTGFGLYLVRELAVANQGSADYQPHQPRGACFTVTLPAADPETPFDPEP